MANEVASSLRYILISLKYPSADISNVQIGSRASIICTDGSKLILQNCWIGNNSMIMADHGATVTIRDTFIGNNCVIVSRESIEIGAGSQLAEMVVIRDQNHRFENPDIPIEKQGFDVSPIKIGSNVWLGAKSTVLKGVTIGDRSVIGANTVVTHNIPEKSVAVGIPAKVIRSI